MRFLTLACLVLLDLGTMPRVRAGDFPLHEYSTAVDRYVSSLDDLSVEYSDEDRTADGSLVFHREHSLLSIPGHMRVKTVQHVTRQGAPVSARTEWSLLRPDGFYVISEKAEGQFVLKSWQQTVTSPLDVGADSPIQILTAPVCRASYPLVRLIRKQVPGHVVNLTDFRRVENGDAMYECRSADEVNGGRAETRYEMNADWLLTRYTMAGITEERRVSYEFAYTILDGRRLPARITARPLDKSGIARPGFEAVFRNYQRAQAQPADFSLAQFGLPESLNYKAPSGSSHQRRYFVVAALLFVVLAVGFRYLARRRRAAPVST